MDIKNDTEEMGYDSRHDTDEYAQNYFLTTFGTEFKDELNQIREKVGRDLEEAISAFADQIMQDYDTPIKSKEEMKEFIWSFI